MQSAEPPCVYRGLSGQAGSPYLHSALVHTEAQSCPHPLLLPSTSTHPPPFPRCPSLPRNSWAQMFGQLQDSAVCVCVSGGNASRLSTEQLFDDGPCCTSLWFQSLQRAGPAYGPVACSHNSHKSQGSGLHRPHISSHRQIRKELLLHTDAGGDLGSIFLSPQWLYLQGGNSALFLKSKIQIHLFTLWVLKGFRQMVIKCLHFWG